MIAPARASERSILPACPDQLRQPPHPRVVRRRDHRPLHLDPVRIERLPASETLVPSESGSPLSIRRPVHRSPGANSMNVGLSRTPAGGPAIARKAWYSAKAIRFG